MGIKKNWNKKDFEVNLASYTPLSSCLVFFPPSATEQHSVVFLITLTLKRAFWCHGCFNLGGPGSKNWVNSSLERSEWTEEDFRYRVRPHPLPMTSYACLHCLFYLFDQIVVFTGSSVLLLRQLFYYREIRDKPLKTRPRIPQIWLLKNQIQTFCANHREISTL